MRAADGDNTALVVERLARFIREGADSSNGAGDRSAKKRMQAGRDDAAAGATRNLTEHVSRDRTRTQLRLGGRLARAAA